MLQLRQLIDEHAGVLGIDGLDLEVFAFKHFKASIDVGKTFREGNGSN
jgi:hypothetical protein